MQGEWLPAAFPLWLSPPQEPNEAPAGGPARRKGQPGAENAAEGETRWRGVEGSSRSRKLSLQTKKKKIVVTRGPEAPEC